MIYINKKQLLALTLCVSSFCHANEKAIAQPFRHILQNEFNDISYTQDDENLYFHVEILDSKFLKGSNADSVSIAVDKNKNGKIDEYIDVEYSTSNSIPCVVYLISEKASSTCGKAPTKAALSSYIGQSKSSPYDHSIFEYHIPKNELSFDGVSASIVFKSYSSKSKNKIYPYSYNGSFTSTIYVRFTEPRVDEKSLKVDNIAPKEELTQQEQDCLLWKKSNSLSPTPEKIKYIINNCK